MGFWLQPKLDQHCSTLEYMLKTSKKATGSCAAWPLLLDQTLKAEGIAGSQVLQVRADPGVNPGADGFLVKQWNFGKHIRVGADNVCTTGVQAGSDDTQLAAVGSSPADGRCVGPGADGSLATAPAGDDVAQDGYFAGSTYPYLTDTAKTLPVIGDAVDQHPGRRGLRGQKNADPPGAFQSHWVVSYSGKIYDPSYGAGPFNSTMDYENAAIDGITSGNRARKNDPTRQEVTFTPASSSDLR
jgi:hypothetical protein